MKRLIMAVCAVSVAVVAAAAYLIVDVTKDPEPTGYTIYVYDNGAGRIDIDSVNAVQQLHEDTDINGKIYKAGTVIIPGNGNEVYYEYGQRRHIEVKGENDE